MYLRLPHHSSLRKKRKLPSESRDQDNWTRMSCPLSSFIRCITLYRNPTVTNPRGGGVVSLLHLMFHSYPCDYLNKLQMLVCQEIYTSQLIGCLCSRFLDAAVLRDQLEIHFFMCKHCKKVNFTKRRQAATPLVPFLRRTSSPKT